MDIATRTFNHTFRIDPIVRTLMDTDFYKFLMQQMIIEKFPSLHVKFKLINRTSSVRLAEIVSEEELREQLDHARSLKFAPNELIWLAGNTFYGQEQIFSQKFISWLKDFRLPDYSLSVRDGQFELEFEGDWASASAWEIPALSIMNELRARATMKAMSRFEIDVLYARAKSTLWSKVVRLRVLRDMFPDLKISDFGTRRRHGFLWQRWCIQALMEGIGDSFTGTSNVKHAMDNGVEAIGTNAHELPMVYAALSKGDEELLFSSYKVLEDWAEFYGDRLRIILPDAFGSTNFLNRAPEWVAGWTGIRPDSKEPLEGVFEYISWLNARGVDPLTKVAILSDGMDIDAIERAYKHLHGRIGGLPIGWGTNLTNDFVGCSPTDNNDLFKPVSLVCKVVEANGRPVVKLSDNPAKATGPRDEIDRYLQVFGTSGMMRQEVVV